jgi:heme exporter protein A
MLTVEQLGLWRGSQMIVETTGFGVEAGWALQIHGANGSGKTTLLRVLAGLMPPDAGRVCWHGANVRAQPARFRRDLAYVGHANGVSDDLTVLENIRFAMRLGAGGARSCTLSGGALLQEREVLTQANLLPLLHTRLGCLSQGQRRRVALARLMLERKPLWVLDEPADALDHAASDWLAQCLVAHMKVGGIVIATTHRPLETPLLRTRYLHLERSLPWTD